MRHRAKKSGRLVPADPAALDAAEQRRRRRLAAFAGTARGAVERVARLAPELEDLADSFPALLYALATGYGAADQRQRALTAVVEGQPLREAAARLGLPFWLRKLPPGAFHAPLVTPPADPQLVNRLVSLIPQTPAAVSAWLDRVLVAHHAGLAAGRPELALWVAQQYRGPHPSARSITFLGTLAWAWHSLVRHDCRAVELLGHLRWTPTMGARRAATEAGLWRERLALEVCLGPGLGDSWLAEGRVGDLDFVALRTASDFIAEAKEMDNCLDRYADRLLGRAVRVFSVRRDGRPVANLEIAPHERESGHPVIAQLRAAHNRRASLDVWQAAYSWLGSQPLRLADRRLEIRVGTKLRSRRQLELWRPFLDALPEQACESLAAILTGRKPGARSRASSPRSPLHASGREDRLAA